MQAKVITNHYTSFRFLCCSNCRTVFGNMKDKSIACSSSDVFAALTSPSQRQRVLFLSATKLNIRNPGARRIWWLLAVVLHLLLAPQVLHLGTLSAKDTQGANIFSGINSRIFLIAPKQIPQRPSKSEERNLPWAHPEYLS